MFASVHRQFRDRQELPAAMDAMRGALLNSAGILAFGRPLLILLVFAAVLLPSSVLIFSRSLRRTKVTETLTHR